MHLFQTSSVRNAEVRCTYEMYQCRNETVNFPLFIRFIIRNVKAVVYFSHSHLTTITFTPIPVSVRVADVNDLKG